MTEIELLIDRATESRWALKEKQRAFGEIVRRYQDLAYGYAYAVVGDFQLAEDAAQEAFLAAWRNLDQLRTPSAFTGWFKRIVLSQCSRLTRGRHLDTVPLEAASALPCSEEDPQRALEREELRLRVHAAVQALPERERIVTSLFYISEYSLKEVAAFLELPLTTVKKRLWSARQKLRESMLDQVKDTLSETRPSRDERFASTVALYNEALDSLVAKLKQDRYVLAAILCGSLSYDEVWEKSDIDLVIVGTEEKKPDKSFCLVENGIDVHASLISRNRFRASMDGSLQGSFTHSIFSRSTLLFSWDQSLEEYYHENVRRVGERDKELALLHAAVGLVYTLYKAEKWLYVKHDVPYCFVWVMHAVNSLAQIETLLHNEVGSREVIQQAMRLNPKLLKPVYTDLIHGKKDEATLDAALKHLSGYLEERSSTIFRPILRYLAEEGGVRSVSEIDAYFAKLAGGHGASSACEWLSDKGFVQKVSAPLRLTEKSRVVLDEAAYYYDGPGPD